MRFVGVRGSFEGESRVDQREVRKALGHVAQEGAGLRIHLFGEQPDIVGQRDGVLHHSTGPLGLAGPDEGIDHPEAAGDERALFRVHAGVAVEERSVAQFGGDGVDSRSQSGSAFEAGASGEEDSGIEVVRSRVKGVGLLGVGPAVLIDPGADLVCARTPAFDVQGRDLPRLGEVTARSSATQQPIFEMV